VLRCDEYLKNPNGYLAGSPAGRVNGWQLQFVPNTAQGLEMRFTKDNAANGVAESGTGDVPGQTLFVRWNVTAKRYQSMDRLHETFLSEVPTLEIPQSILK
jgi:hypothetical protein